MRKLKLLEIYTIFYTIADYNIIYKLQQTDTVLIFINVIFERYMFFNNKVSFRILVSFLN